MREPVVVVVGGGSVVRGLLAANRDSWVVRNVRVEVGRGESVVGDVNQRHGGGGGETVVEEV